MTKNDVVRLCLAVQDMPFCTLETESGPFRMTHKEYWVQMKRNSPWCTPYGEDAIYNDGVSEQQQDAWYKAAALAKTAVHEYESTHKGPIPLWAKKL